MRANLEQLADAAMIRSDGSLGRQVPLRYAVLVGVLVSTVLSVPLDLPVLRPLVGFLFLTFTPGLLFLEVLRLNQLDCTERVLLAMGLSISFLMLFGLLINSVYPLFGCDTPLSPNSLLVSFSVAGLLLGVCAYVRNHSWRLDATAVCCLNTREKLFLLAPALFPLLSIGGMYIMNTTGVNAFVMALLLLIPAYVIWVIAKGDDYAEGLHTPVLLSIGLSVALMYGLRSNHVIGVDVHTEYYLFQQTLQSGQWRVLLNSPLDSCLSISILPAIYQAYLAVHPEMLFKTLYPALVSGAPVAVYLVARQYIGPRYAFLAALFFVSQPLFQAAAYNPRTVLAILFFALAIMVLFRRGLGVFASRLFSLVFAAACVLSHYTTSYIFLFLLLLTLVVRQAILPRTGPDDEARTERYLSTGAPSFVTMAKSVRLRRSRVTGAGRVSIALATVLCGVIFVWHGYVTGKNIAGGVNFVAGVLRRLSDLMVAEARTEAVQGAFGAGLGERTVPGLIGWAAWWLTIVLIAIGVLTTFVWYWRFGKSPELRHNEGLSQRLRCLDGDFIVLSLVASALLVLQVALPYVEPGYGFWRNLLQMAVVLSLFFVIGGLWIADRIRTQQPCLVILAVLVPFFMYTSGSMYQLFGVPEAVTLNSEGQYYENMVTYDTESHAAQWLGSRAASESVGYCDRYGNLRLTSQGGITWQSYSEGLIERHESPEAGYVYLRRAAVFGGYMMDRFDQRHDVVTYRDEFAGLARVYASNGAEVFAK